jgi:hypothetical protein
MNVNFQTTTSVALLTLFFSIAQPVHAHATAEIKAPHARSKACCQCARQSLRFRVHQGVRSGQLTPTELTQIKARFGAIRSFARALRADGAISASERSQLRAQIIDSAKLVYALKHNTDAVAPANR